MQSLAGVSRAATVISGFRESSSRSSHRCCPPGVDRHRARITDVVNSSLMVSRSLLASRWTLAPVCSSEFDDRSALILVKPSQGFVGFHERIIPLWLVSD